MRSDPHHHHHHRHQQQHQQTSAPGEHDTRGGTCDATGPSAPPTAYTQTTISNHSSSAAHHDDHEAHTRTKELILRHAITKTHAESCAHTHTDVLLDPFLLYLLHPPSSSSSPPSHHLQVAAPPLRSDRPAQAKRLQLILILHQPHQQWIIDPFHRLYQASELDSSPAIRPRRRPEGATPPHRTPGTRHTRTHPPQATLI